MEIDPGDPEAQAACLEDELLPGAATAQLQANAQIAFCRLDQSLQFTPAHAGMGEGGPPSPGSSWLATFQVIPSTAGLIEIPLATWGLDL